MRTMQWGLLLLSMIVSPAYSVDADIARAIWVQQAILSTYHYDHHDYLGQQKQIARYFTAKAWMDYSKALSAAQMPQQVQEHQWTVTAVAIRPPTVSALPEHHWQAEMPILVSYRNDDKEQLQTINVRLQFTGASGATGVDGYAIVSFQSRMIGEPCTCALTQAKANRNQN
ncbi:MAG: DotI/IcmL family type IV secretion protein [Legionellaceae bacterium]|nr:DotI/IcmL family type IV secretion protein [Legionellaceae bacterium]